MFNDKQLQVLKHDLDPSRIRSRTKGNTSLAYLEGFDVIQTANQVFGHGNWSYSLTSLTEVSRETNSNGNFVVCYQAIINFIAHNLEHSLHVSREDVGYGSGISKSLADAHESAGKEATTDALKRAMRSFGNQFGNGLYNKSRQQNQPQQIPVQSYDEEQPQRPQIQNNHQSYSLQEYASLLNIGLQVLQRGGDIVVAGEDLFNKKDSIKACGFRWDGNRKLWYKSLNQSEAA